MHLIFLTVLLLAGTAQAEVYKCVQAGKATYTDKPCTANAEPAVLPPVQNVPGRDASDLAAQFDARVAQGKKDRDASDAAFIKEHTEKANRAKAVRKAIIDHAVIEGMTPSEVHSAVGTADETLPDGRWRYHRDGERLTVRFKDGRVASVNTIRERKK